MGRGPYPRGGRPRTQPVLDHVLRMSIDNANGEFDSSTGRYAEVVLNGIATRDQAESVKRSMYRSARYMKVSLHQKIERAGDGWQIRFTVINKDHARNFVNAIPPERRAYNQHIRVVGE